MLPAIALVGRPNVGKSTLFNRLTGTRDALVADYPGLTRDRLYGYFRRGNQSAVVIDTGGLSGDRDEVSQLMARQVELAVEEADVVLFLVEASTGLTPGDENIAELLRRSGTEVRIVVNKSEGLNPDETAAEFWALGMGEPAFLLALPVALFATLGFMLPVATPPNAVIFGSGVLEMRHMLRAGVILDIVGIFVVAAAVVLLV